MRVLCQLVPYKLYKINLLCAEIYSLFLRSDFCEHFKTFIFKVTGIVAGKNRVRSCAWLHITFLTFSISLILGVRNESRIVQHCVNALLLYECRCKRYSKSPLSPTLCFPVCENKTNLVDWWCQRCQRGCRIYQDYTGQPPVPCNEMQHVSSVLGKVNQPHNSIKRVVSLAHIESFISVEQRGVLIWGIFSMLLMHATFFPEKSTIMITHFERLAMAA